MVMEAIEEYIWLATCQGKIDEKNPPPSVRHKTKFFFRLGTILKLGMAFLPVFLF